MLPTVTAQSPAPACARSHCAAPKAPPVVVRESLVETYSRSTRVEIRGSSTGQTLGGTSGVEAYRAVQDAKQDINPFAKTILSFIDAQIRRDVADGASAEELKSRLEAGLQGFQQGYGEAFEQLSASGLLDDDLRTQIESTQTQVVAGIGKLADELGIEVELPAVDEPVQSENPSTPGPQKDVTSAPVVNPGKAILSSVLRDVQILEQYQKSSQSEVTYQHLGRAKSTPGHSYAYGVQESRSFSLKLRTADGDGVTIRLSTERAGMAQYAASNTGASLTRQGSQAEGFQFSVDGELDEGEMRALTDLLQQVGDISEEFFAGDLDSAFKLASELSFDSAEISTFDLAWNMNRSEAAQVAPLAGQPDKPASFAPNFSGLTPRANGFAESIHRAGNYAERLGQPRSLVADLLDWVARSHQTEKPYGAMLAPAARAVL